MKRLVWFGEMTHGTFNIGGDSNEMVIVHQIDLAIEMDVDEVDDFMVENHYNSYLIPSMYDGELVFSDAYVIIKEMETYND
jgi:hypothetical protein